MRNPQFFATFLKDFAVKVISAIYFVSFAHAIELQNMRQFMQKNPFK